LLQRLSIFTLLIPVLLLTAQAQPGAPENLTATVDQDGHVVLTWTTPAGYFPSSFEIRRGHSSPDMSIAQIYGPTSQFTDFNVRTGVTYQYSVAAQYADRYSVAYTWITVLPPPGGLEFISIPRSTAVVGNDYFYSPEVNQSNRGDMSYMLIGKVPEGMRTHRIADGTSWIHWIPDKVGQFSITLQVTDQSNGSQAYQEFTITVADRPGTVRGFVKNTIGDPLPQATVRVWMVSASYNLKYETTTDSNGEFILDDVQAGPLVAFASEPSASYASQFYINAPSINTAMTRWLKEGDTLNYPFFLLPKAGTAAPVEGRVVDGQKNAIANAKVSFIRKENFIHIGDTTQINSWQDNTITWRESLIDTSILTGPNGSFVAHLPIGQDYYTIVEKDAHIRSFIGVQTNAMEARAIRIENDLMLHYELQSVTQTSNKVVGKVLSQESGLGKQATIVLIDSELKRGAGGGHTYGRYRSVVTDTNGVFVFDNLSESPPSALLAIPMDSRLAPQYYHSSGGRSNFRESEELTPFGTVQNINFELRSTKRSGIGSCYGQVILKEGSLRTPLPGTLIIAERERDGAIAGYSITDSTGWYSITGLDPDNYLVYADHPSYSYTARYTEARPSKSMPVQMTYNSSSDPNRLLDVDFLIEDKVTSVEEGVVPSSIALYQNYPNPFNPSTEIRFALPLRAHVTLRVVNALGELVSTIHEGVLDAGTHTRQFHASEYPSGVYFYQLLTETTVLSRGMMLMK
jgi:hypothetical protein